MSYQVNPATLPALRTVVGETARESAAQPQAKPQKSSRFPQSKSILADRILRSFNTRAFKREQPDHPDLMLHVIREAIERQAPVAFASYWGKGPRSHMGEPEAKTLEYLTTMLRRIGTVYEPGAALTLIFTDTHAAHNGHAPESIRSYFGEVAAAAHQHGFAHRWLSELTRGIEPPEAVPQSLPGEIAATLYASARKWYFGSGMLEEGALRYYQMNQVEKRAVELAFPRSIFITFNGSDLRCLLPAGLPVFYMFSLRHGVSDKPWFLPAQLPARGAPADRPQPAYSA
jgi:hypothetical protein